MPISVRVPYLCVALLMVGVISSTATSTKRASATVRSEVDALGMVRTMNINAQDPAEVHGIAASNSSSFEEDVDRSGQNCGASMAVDARYCIYRNRQPTCSHTALQVGEIVPLRIRVKNRANYEDIFGNSVYIPAKIPKGTMFQIVFACSDTNCGSASGNALEFVSFESDTEPSGVFKPGPAPGFNGVNKCSGLSNANTACGYITVGNDIQLQGNANADVGILTMRAKAKVSGRIVAHVAADRVGIMTTGGICHPELSASGAGTCQAVFA